MNTPPSTPAPGVLVLAAGASTRMGRAKALLDTGGGTTALARLLGSARAAGLGAAFVVVAEPHGRDIAAAAARAGATTVWNPDPARGMLSSIQVGLRAASAAGVPGVVLWPVDHALVAAATVRALVAASRADRFVLPLTAGERGHPVVIGAARMDSILALDPTTATLRDAWRAAAAESVVALEVDDPLCTCVANDPEGFARALELASTRDAALED